MSKECVNECPKINGLVAAIQLNNLLSTLNPIHTEGFVATGPLEEMVKESAYCTGVQEKDVAVEKGIFNRRTVYEHKAVCGLTLQPEK